MSTDDSQRDTSRWSTPTPATGWTRPSSRDGGQAAHEPFGYDRTAGADGRDTAVLPGGRNAGWPPAAGPARPEERYGAQRGGAFGYGAPHQGPYPGPGAPHGPVPGAPAPGAPGVPDRRGRRYGWGSVAATAAAAALLASLGTAGITGALDDDGAPTTAATSTSTDDPGTNAEPVVTSTTDDPDWANVAAAVRPTVVAIDVRTPAGPGSGSGVILDEDGHILTNNHVVGGAVDGGLVVTLSDGRMYEATIAGLDPATDLAVITITDPPSDLQAATLGSSEEVVIGDPVAAVGNPLGLSSTVTTGIVSALDRPVSTREEGQQTAVVTNAIQVDAAINPGNSGGPLFDAAGRVIGINSSIASMSSQSGNIGLGFAIPIDLAKLVSDQLIENGVAEHAFLGVSLGDGTATADGETRAGAVVGDVEPGAPADEAGVRAGDVITAIDGDPVGGAESLIGFVRQYASGDEVTLTVVRDGEEIEVSATLATREDQNL